MTKIIQFNQGNKEEHCCPNCDLVLSYIGEVIESESPEELFEVLSELVLEAKELGLKEYLIAELEAKVELLDQLEYGCDGNCEDCNCDE